MNQNWIKDRFLMLLHKKKCYNVVKRGNAYERYYTLSWQPMGS